MVLVQWAFQLQYSPCLLVLKKHAICSWMRNFKTSSTSGRRKSSKKQYVFRKMFELHYIRLGSPRKSIRWHSAELHIRNRTVRRILKHVLYFRSYKIQLVRELKERGFTAQNRFWVWKFKLFREEENGSRFVDERRSRFSP